MAITNHERVGKALELLKSGLGPFVEREFKNTYKDRAAAEASRFLGEDRLNAKKPIAEWDAAALLKLMWEAWNDVFRQTLGHAERSLVSELRDHRNKWAHQESFSSDDAYRALDSAGRLLTAVSAPQADEIEKMKMELLRLRFDEQVRSEKRKSAGTAIESAAAGNLKPWREVVTPHKDVASGRYQQAEFAADLWQVHLGEGHGRVPGPGRVLPPHLSHREPEADAGRRGAAPRRPGRRPGGAAPDQLRRRQDALDAGALSPVLRHRAHGAGRHRRGACRRPGRRSCRPSGAWCWWATRSRPAIPSTKPDGTVVRTLWGELAWQLGGKKAFARVKADDEKATSPGDVLRELFIEYGPCLILIDEWVAYARQLHDQSDLPAGGFETQFTFAQVLTESAKLAKNCLLVISLPASDTTGSPHAQADDVEVGGQRGREALDRLRNVVGRVESSWRPASAEEGFEIVRRRLFEPLADPAQFKDRDVVARAFADLYRTQQPGVPARVPRRRLREAHQGGLPDPPGDLRPALHRLVHAGEVPAHPRRAAADGGGDPQPVGEGRPEPAHPAGEHLDRRPARAVRADALPLGQLGAGDREGRGRPELAAAADGRRGAEPRQVRGLPACGARHLPGFGAPDARPRIADSKTGG